MEANKILEQKIEAVLFWKGEPISISKLASILKSDETAINSALDSLGSELTERGVRLIRKENEVVLATAPEVADLIETITREELVRDLGKAGLETLAIILYQGPIVRSEIDYIRGVNSQFIIRNLLVRGLVEKVTDERDQRRFLYKPTFELLAHLGVSKIEDLPEYVKVRDDIEAYKHENQESKPDQTPIIANQSDGDNASEEAKIELENQVNE